MKKLVLKTALFTLAGILALGVILFGVFALFSPKTIANTADKMGNYSVSVFYYEKAYEKSNSLEDLYTLIVKLDESEDGARTEKYCDIMFKPALKGEVAVFTSKLDSKTPASTVTTCEYLYGKYAVALCSQTGASKITKLTTVCFNYIEEYGYTENCPLTTAVSVCGKNLTKEQLLTITNAITQKDIEGGFDNLTSLERSRLNSDRIAINRLISEKN